MLCYVMLCYVCMYVCMYVCKSALNFYQQIPLNLHLPHDKFEALLGSAELGEGELERLMAATREYSEMRVKGKFGRGSGAADGKMGWWM